MTYTCYRRETTRESAITNEFGLEWCLLFARCSMCLANGKAEDEIKVMEEALKALNIKIERGVRAPIMESKGRIFHSVVIVVLLSQIVDMWYTW
jgi:hypothetical protein